MRRALLVVAAGVLVLGPWLPSPGLAATPPSTSFRGALAGASEAIGAQPAEPSQERRVFVRRGCTCREIVVDATNEVRNADVRTGDAKVVNRSITYVAPSYTDDEVEVEQEAVARSGHAIAGQVIGVVAGGDGCASVLVRATNIVEDAKVRSGDAVARNQSVVLVDPRVERRGDVEIEVDQKADASSGVALAGQVIGVLGGGGRCGGVTVEAVNQLKGVDVRTGEAAIHNLSAIWTCRDTRCLEQIRLMLAFVDSVQVCAEDGCEEVPTDEFIAMLERQAAERDQRRSGDADEATPGDAAAPSEPVGAGADDDGSTDDDDGSTDDEEDDRRDRPLPRPPSGWPPPTPMPRR